MTTGTITIGSFPGTDRYYKKQWSGADGKYSSPGIFKNNPYWMTSSEIITKQSKVMCFEGYPCSHWCYNYGYMITGSYPPALNWDTNDDLKLLGRLSEKIRRHDFDMGNFIGEGRQTLGSVLGTLASFRQSVRLVRRGDLSGALRTLGRSSASGSPALARKAKSRALTSQDVGSAWLSMQYAWLPLLSDVFAGATAFEALTSKPRSQVYEARYKKSVSGDASGYPNEYTMPSTVKRVDRYRYRLTEELSTARSLGLYDPIGVAWERVPYSFVADWFLPVGSYLDALSVYPFLKGEWVKTSFQKSESSFGSAISSRWRCDTHRFDWRQVTLTRSVGTDPIQVPPPSFNNPWKAMQAGNRIYNSVALLRNLFK